jgi:hypothetical protein
LGGLSYFAGAEKKDERVLVPDLGSLTSVYDRYVCALEQVLNVLGSASFISFFFPSLAFFLTSLENGVFGFRARELFYYLKGGQVDYGEEHSKACGHSQFGRVYEQGNRSPALQLALSVRVFLF